MAIIDPKNPPFQSPTGGPNDPNYNPYGDRSGTPGTSGNRFGNGQDPQRWYSNGFPNPLEVEGAQAGNPNSPQFEWGSWDPSTMRVDEMTGRLIYGGATQDISRYQNIAGQYRNQAAPVANLAGTQPYVQAGNQGLSLMQQAALGNAPSVAQSQMQQGLGQALMNQQALAAGARGAGAMGIAQANAAQGAAALQNQTVGNAAQLRASEMANARGQYLQGAMGLAGQQSDWAFRQAQLQEQQNQLNAQAGLGYEQLGYNVGNAQLQAKLEQQNQAEGHWRAQTGADEASVDRTYNSLMGGVGAGAGMIGAMGGGGGASSDIGAKYDVASDDAPTYMGGGQKGSGAIGTAVKAIGMAALLSDREAKEQVARDAFKAGQVEAQMMGTPENRGLLALSQRVVRDEAVRKQAMADEQRMAHETRPLSQKIPQHVLPYPAAKAAEYPLPAAPERYPVERQNIMPFASRKAAEGAMLEMAARPSPPTMASLAVPVRPNPVMTASQMAATTMRPPADYIASDEHIKISSRPVGQINLPHGGNLLAGESSRYPGGRPGIHTHGFLQHGAQQLGFYAKRGNEEASNTELRLPESMSESVPSDERIKETGKETYNRLPLSEALKETDADKFLDTLHPFTYRYKSQADEPTSQPNGGRYLGTIAQEIEKSPTGSTLVTNTPRGKVLETGAMMSAMSAGLGRLHERVRELERLRKGMK